MSGSRNPRHANRTKQEDTDSSPISTIPLEILIQIFESFILLQRDARPLPSNSASIFLSHVTRHWREVVLKTPTLWTKISLSNHSSRVYIQTCLQRSGECGLDICIRPFEKTVAVDELFTLLIAEVHRWRSLTVDVHTRELCHGILDQLRIRTLAAPLLQSLDIHLSGIPADRQNWTESRIFDDGAPLLSSVKFYGIASQTYCPPLSAVTSLTLGKPATNHASRVSPIIPNYQMFQDTLRSCRALRTLVLSDAVFWHGPEDQIVTPLQIPSLLSLTVKLPTIGNYAPYIAALATIVAPSLQELTLVSTNGVLTPVFTTGFCTGKQYPHLHTVNFLEVDGTEFIGEDFIRAIPHLIELNFGATSYDSILSMLCASTATSNERLWADLQRLSVAYYNEDLLRAFLTSRREMDTLIVRSAVELIEEDKRVLSALVRTLRC